MKGYAVVIKFGDSKSKKKFIRTIKRIESGILKTDSSKWFVITLEVIGRFLAEYLSRLASQNFSATSVEISEANSENPI